MAHKILSINLPQRSLDSFVFARAFTQTDTRSFVCASLVGIRDGFTE